MPEDFLELTLGYNDVEQYGEKWTPIKMLPGKCALAVKSNEPMPAPVYVIQMLESQDKNVEQLCAKD